jgi:ribosomal-protein-alanine N-acetyltransferase
MNSIEKNKLVTQRLLLRPFRLSDASALFAWSSDEEVVKYLRFIPHKSVDESIKVINSWMEKDLSSGICNWAIVKKETNTPIGSIAVETTSAIDQRGEVGYCIAKEHWNHGYMSEALPYVLRHAFTFMNLHRIEASHSLNNPASGKVMQNAHMQKECSYLRHYYKGGLTGYQDTALYVAFSDTYDLPSTTDEV